MPDVDLAKMGSVAGMNPPGGLEGPAIASAASITLSHPVHKITGTGTITTMVPPHVGFVGSVTLVAIGAFGFGTGGNVSKTLTATANVVYRPYFDGAVWYLDA